MGSDSQLSVFETGDPPNLPPYGWAGTVEAFLRLAPEDWLAALLSRCQGLYQQRATQTQQQAWQDCGQVLRSRLPQLCQQRPTSAAWTLVFEYELPREGGRRPDLVILADGQIGVLEFKQKASPAAADRDQAAAYGRDLAEYHSGSRLNPVQTAVVLTRRTQPAEWKAIAVLGPADLVPYLAALEPTEPNIDPSAWLTADYAPLPTVIQAARRIFQNQPLPSIRQAHSAGIPAVLDYLNQLVEQAQARQERHLVLVTGVPGAGKTLVGLQFVYQSPQSDGPSQAVLLSGNGPLITVLQYALKSRAFVQAVRNFYMAHQVRQQKAPREHVIVFDEAQRAWDAGRMGDKYGIAASAPEIVLRITERTPSWGVVLGLIGEGQEIHVGEEAGMEQWSQGIAQAQADWQVHCPVSQTGHFADLSSPVHAADGLDLTTTLRSHLAADLQHWVSDLLKGQLQAAAARMPRLRDQGFDAYLTRQLDRAKDYCRQRYQDQPTKRYGLIASSRAKNLTDAGIKNDYLSTQRLKVGPWYIDPPDSPLSCCALAGVVTEFGCQGLELDFPIIGWGNDLTWQQLGWRSSVRQRQVRDPLRLRLNSYRVLLTRGRDGFIVFVPPQAAMDGTYDALVQAGLRALESWDSLV
ncbi:DUF2075 domain-containing protein [Romeria aff. gracilis LEGE 07310]|uniref:DUF2075 domain-containing protein n=1 Tax=Vasconcelosia minhoensis LEGE 07310 TaxID=915328 RepID=A0A8J7ARZ5_9CYAN|nr:DNA/RNA helicase domain-containing protein [Romeria gracilis]MBE9079531.1 DUF2075 domain-containing protein [Romeria aff. gracilis LEGE 07310]